MRGTAHGRSCLACIRAKQKCEGATFGKAERPVAGNPVVEALGEIVRVLKGIRGDIQELMAAVDDRWASADNDEFDGGDSETEGTGEELPGLREEMKAGSSGSADPRP
jgi:hypothetical protein